MSAVFDGPVELIRAIFHMAATEEKSTALNLVCVCKAVREWIMPIIYETVELDNPSAVQFEKMLTMPSSSSVACLVRQLRVTCLPNVDLLSSRCRAVQAMTIANHDMRHLRRLKLPSLTHLTIGGSLRHTHLSADMAPALATVTHLRFTHDVPRLPDNIPTIMPHLTHFWCCYRLSKKTQHRELEQCVSRVMRVPRLRVACVQTQDGGGGGVLQMLGMDDLRLVAVSSADIVSETRREGCWIVAEAKVARAQSELVTLKARLCEKGF